MFARKANMLYSSLAMQFAIFRSLPCTPSWFFDAGAPFTDARHTLQAHVSMLLFSASLLLFSAKKFAYLKHALVYKRITEQHGFRGSNAFML